MGRKMLPGRFAGLAAFVGYCHAQIESHGPDVAVVILWSGPAPRSGRREIAPGGLFAVHRGMVPERAGWQYYEVGAQAFADAAEQGRLIETTRPTSRR
ncbi:hypothetical protein [Deinococcus rufus]|uniref:Uncharacterized protein n=1 Tax=Deinococcus rufus TaxID=2136097 RepID=A0ABV7Z9Y2_9DEIO